MSSLYAALQQQAVLNQYYQQLAMAQQQHAQNQIANPLLQFGAGGMGTASSTNTTGGSGGSMWVTTTSNTTGATTNTHCTNALGGGWDDPWAETIANDGTIRIPDGYAPTIKLPDGTEIAVKHDGSFEIKDKDAKVVYRASRIREFNPFINCSDRIEQFIAYCGAQGVHKDEMLQLPLKLFIGWLILEAAKADKEPEPEVKLLPDLRRVAKPRCQSCMRFISHAMKAAHLEFCNPRCFERKFAAIGD